MSRCLSNPYIGLRPYRYEDKRIYKGRSNDIKTCLKFLNSPLVRVLVIHGPSGSGKSSFLQAGLIPAIEENPPSHQNFGFKLLFPDKIISSGVSFFSHLGKQLYQTMFSIDSSIANEAIENWKNKFSNEEVFIDEINRDIDTFRKLMITFSKNPFLNWILVVDHAERMFENSVDKKTRRMFFSLIRDFDRELFNSKIVISIRTENYGEFASSIPEYCREVTLGEHSINRLSHHFLEPPDERSLIDIVTTPCQNHESGFSYQDKLPEKIIKTIIGLPGDEINKVSPLPMIQALCSVLYNQVIESKGCKDCIISEKDFENYMNPKVLSKEYILKKYIETGLNLSLETGGYVSPFERNRWHQLLLNFVNFHIEGRVETKPRQESKVIDDAVAANCRIDPEIVIRNMKKEPFSILSDLNGSLYLSHDLLAIALKNNTDHHEESFADQNLLQERIRINDAAKYNENKLYEKLPLTNFKFAGADLRFWDHRVFRFAIEKGFFSRLGLNIKIHTIYDNKTASEIVDTLLNESKEDSRNNTVAIFTYPRSLMSEKETECYTDIGILNSFTGYAIIMDSFKTKFLPWDEINSFNEIFHQFFIKNIRFIAEDTGAKEFIYHLLELYNYINNTDRTIKVDLCKTFSPTTIVNEISKKDTAAIITAPSHSLIRDIGNCDTVIDQSDSLLIIEELKKKGCNNSHVFQNKFITNNCLNISIRPPNIKLQEKFSDNDRMLLLRFLSATLFSIDYVRLNDDEVINWIYHNWIWTEDEKPTIQSVTDIYRKSSHYFPTKWYPEIYFEPDSPYYFKSFYKFDAKYTNICDKIYFELLSLQKKYLDLVVQTRDMNQSEIPNKIRILIERASLHAKIYNYYDAVQIIRDALTLFKEETSC